MNISNEKIPNKNNEKKSCLLISIIIASIILLFIVPPLGIILISIVIIYLLLTKKKRISKKKIKNLEENIKILQKDNEALNKKLKHAALSKEQSKYFDLDEKIKILEKEYAELNNKKNLLNKEIITTEDNLNMQSFGFYETKYNFETSEEYKMRLEIIRKSQKEMIKKRVASAHSLDWRIQNDKKKGRKFILDTIKLSLRAFNNECDNIIAKVKYNNINIAKTRINKIFNDINSLTDMQKVFITEQYLKLKLDELELKYEYECKLQEEKQKQQEEKERLKEEAKVRKELELAKKKIEKEEQHFVNAITELKAKVDSSSDKEKENLLKKLKELEDKLNTIEEAKKDIENRELNNKAGYVYIISNIGSFGEDVYKIGMTRRLDPMERVKELGGASVPFTFDVHAMIFTEDAPKLESKLHERFRYSEVNKVNHRKEFFKAKLDIIEKVIKEEFDKPVDFIKIAKAEEYKKSMLINI